MAIPSALFTILKHERELRSCQPQEIVFEQGTPGDHLFVILEGEVDITLNGRILDTHGPGEVFGEMALIDKQPRSATAVARTACRLALVDEKRFAQLVQGHPYFALDLMRVLADRLRRRTSA
jgi:CRP-like cAMP-binding protein